MKKHLQLLALLAFFANSIYGQTVNFDVQLDQLDDSLGVPVSLTGTVVLVADTAGDGFSRVGIVPSVQTGGFIDTIDSAVDDLIIGVLPITTTLYLSPAQSGVVSEGQFSVATSQFSSTQLNVGDPLAAVWFPTVSGGGQVNAGDTFGIFYNPSLYGSSDPSYYDLGGSYGAASITLALSTDGSSVWSMPADGANDYALYLWTSDSEFGGSFSDSISNAAFTAIPEPSTYAAIIGVVGLLYVGYRRRKNKAAA